MSFDNLGLTQTQTPTPISTIKPPVNTSSPIIDNISKSIGAPGFSTMTPVQAPPEKRTYDEIISHYISISFI